MRRLLSILFTLIAFTATSQSVPDNKGVLYTLSSVNVRDFGAKGDSITDDRAAIQRAADSAYARKKSLYIPAGIYKMGTTTIAGKLGNLFLNPGQIVYGDGDLTILKRDTGYKSGYCIRYNNTSQSTVPLKDRNYTIKNLKILGATVGRGYEFPGTSNDDGGIFLANGDSTSNKILIENVTVENVNKEAIAVWDAKEAILRGNKVYNANHDAYNPEVIESLIMQGNYANGVNFSVEYNGLNRLGIPSSAIISGNEFINCFEYGIAVEGGDNVKINNNILSGDTGKISITGQPIGIFIKPVVANILNLEIGGNTISNFKTSGIGMSNTSSTDSIVKKLTIKSNSIFNTGSYAIRLAPYVSTKMKNIEITNNTIYDWNRIDNGNSFVYCAISLVNTDSTTIFNNRIFSTKQLGKRNDPLYISNTANVRFFNNDCAGFPSNYSDSLYVIQENTNTGTAIYNNVGLGGNGSGTLSAGSNTQVQYNYYGVNGANSGFTFDPSTQTLGLNGSNAEINMTGITTEPSAPSVGNALVYAKSVSGRMMLKIKGTSGLSSPLQPALFQNTIWMITPNTTTTMSNIGGTITTGGTASTPTPTATSYGVMTNFVSGAVATNPAGAGGALAPYMIGTGATGQAGGWFSSSRCFYPDASYGSGSTGFITFVGMTDQTFANSVIADNATGSRVGFGMSTNLSETNFMFSTKNGTTETRTSTGMASTAQHLYDFYTFIPPSGTTVSWRIDDITAGTTQSGTVTATLPSSTTLMRYVAGISTLTTTARNFRIKKCYVETDL